MLFRHKDLTLLSNFNGNTSIVGTLTCQNVTGVDSIEVVTARTGIQVLAGGINAVGIITATSFVGSGANSRGQLENLLLWQ